MSIVRRLQNKPSSEGTVNNVLKDIMISSLLAMFFIILVLVLIIKNDSEKEASVAEVNYCSIKVEMLWDKDLNHDIDLWVKAAGDQAVGYSNKNTLVNNLERDDLGRYNDLLDLNYETVCSRGAPNGTWIVNVVWFAGKTIDEPYSSSGERPDSVQVDVSVTSKKEFDDPSPVKYKTTVHLHSVKEELNAFQFRVEENKMVLDSVNFEQTPIQQYEGE